LEPPDWKQYPPLQVNPEGHIPPFAQGSAQTKSLPLADTQFFELQSLSFAQGAPSDPGAGEPLLPPLLLPPEDDAPPSDVPLLLAHVGKG
jgi:hypothetical protein